ncbi:uncharacterized protein L203_102630 [Cryptococcus depauperatus CBS 7841]|uniref:Cell division control protein 14 n=1 Tax=Cryptococcus depauperatus CBS 7841 TaxID=1295531 RepID=A0AAJ8JS50_9TREE
MATPRKSHRKSHSTPAIVNGTSVDSLHGLAGMVDERRREREAGRQEKRARGDGTVEELLADANSLRSSPKRRFAALSELQHRLVKACNQADATALQHILSHQRDSLAVQLVPELQVAAEILQGLCLLSHSCKEDIGNEWILEMFIDLLLLLRSQTALSIPPSPTQDTAPQKAIAYTLLELFFCIMVDSPRNAKMFEKLSGLEAVVKCLKGSSVGKDVRMKCIEFLYFYLLPEQSTLSDSNSNLNVSAEISNARFASNAFYPPSSPQFPASLFSLSSGLPRSSTNSLVISGSTHPSDTYL